MPQKILFGHRLRGVITNTYLNTAFSYKKAILL